MFVLPPAGCFKEVHLTEIEPPQLLAIMCDVCYLIDRSRVCLTSQPKRAGRDPSVLWSLWAMEMESQVNPDTCTFNDDPLA